MRIRLSKIIVVLRAHALDSPSAVELGPHDLIGFNEFVELSVESVVLVVEDGGMLFKCLLLRELVYIAESESLLLNSADLQIASDAVGLLLTFSESALKVFGLRAQVKGLGVLEVQLFPQLVVLSRLSIDVRSQQTIVTMQPIVVILHAMELARSVL